MKFLTKFSEFEDKLRKELYMETQKHGKLIVVEGVDDFMIITELSNLFERSCLKALPDNVQLTLVIFR